MNKQLVQSIFEKKYSGKCPHLCRDTIVQFVNETIQILFPQIGQNQFQNQDELENAFKKVEKKLIFILSCIQTELKIKDSLQNEISHRFFEELIKIEEQLEADALFIASEDPASLSLDEVVICYPGFFAIAVYRIAHFFYEEKVPLLPRIFSEYAHERTGIDIHPGAKIQSPFFIDHGTGIVIGETTEIGQYCKIFQGVTLGALSVKRHLQNMKRHPTIEDHCLIYSNATILGGETVIGHNSTIGGNVWITESIPANSQVYRKHGFEIETKKI